MLKSRALPDDFDTTKVLRTPFESTSTGRIPIASPQGYGAPKPDFTALTGLHIDCFQRPNEDGYLVSPLSSTSTVRSNMSTAGQGRTDGLPHMVFSRPATSASMSDLHRTIWSDYSNTRSSNMSESSTQSPSIHPGMQLPSRYGVPNQPYGVSRHPSGMVPAYDQHQSFEGSVSPTDSRGAQMPYDMSNLDVCFVTFRTSPNNQISSRLSTPKLPFRADHVNI